MTERRKARKQPEYKLHVRSTTYQWEDADGQVHVTDADGLPPEMRGADGHPQLPAGHPAWGVLFDMFYEALNRSLTAQDPPHPMSKEAYWHLWDTRFEMMHGLYSDWLGKPR